VIKLLQNISDTTGSDLYTRRFYTSSNLSWESLKAGFHSKRTAETNRKGLINKIKP
jgi:hypothetical protein